MELLLYEQTYLHFGIALHLAALDSPKKTVQEVTAVLLLAGLDTAALSSDNKTALEMAENVKNEGFLSTYKEYHGMYSDETVMQKYEALKEDLNTRYCFQVNTKTRGDVASHNSLSFCSELLSSKRYATGTVIPFEAKFPLPDFLFEAGRTGNIPDELTIHEHQIKPLVQSGYHDMRRLEALACLNFTKQESLNNLQRREHLVELSRDESFTRVEVSYKKLDSL